MNGPRYRPRGDRPLRRPPLDSSRLRGPAADPSVEQRIRELDAEREPLSLAEEIASERGASLRRDPVDGSSSNGHASAPLPTVAELQRMSLEELRSIAEQENVSGAAAMEKRELVFKILKSRLKNNGLMYGEGTLEILPDGFGFLRSSTHHYLSCPDDIYVSPSQIRRFGLRNGVTVSGQIRPPKENERYFALLRVEALNYHDPELRHEKVGLR